ncbi:MAG: hypothetical protein JO112_14220 [Planctomycetes bacterium]|nr:hypothetical protein [Planctomycetota bacterium]
MFPVQYPDPLGILNLTGLIVVEGDHGDPFSKPGDSGALVFSLEFVDRRPVGILFADNRGQEGKGLSVVCPWKHLQKLGVQLLPGIQDS